MTNDVVPARREVISRRVEYRLPTDVEGLDYRAVVDRLDATLRQRRTGTSPVRVRAEDAAIVVFYDEEVTDASDAVRVLRERQLALHDALGGRPDGPVAYWEVMLNAVRANARLAEAVAVSARNRGGDAYREVVPALLPHDWSQQLDRLLPAAGNQLALLDMVRRVIDDWRLLTEDVVDEAVDATGEAYRD